ncbi:PAS domain-containing protein [Sphingomonas crocodyli]|uniref:PAS domain S-box protein n=1 Tax=Sphingomonas crocodyli TaxID=1979270 RepID=A0A437LY59_9SPHN|nr:PAS domain-containing protein [Sphingomonas crocodyli]RVT90341.1 PAS domain S-box protein [Sphingomonas crocodyli]
MGIPAVTKAYGLCIADPDGTIRDVDDRFCQLIGFGPNTFVGRHPLDLTHHADRGRNATALSRLIETDRPFVIRKRYLLPDGSLRWVENCVRGVRDGRSRRLLAEMKPIAAPVASPIRLQREDAIFSRLEQIAQADAQTGNVGLSSDQTLDTLAQATRKGRDQSVRDSNARYLSIASALMLPSTC